jgi:hypothetical protein
MARVCAIIFIRKSITARVCAIIFYRKKTRREFAPLFYIEKHGESLRHYFIQKKITWREFAPLFDRFFNLAASASISLSPLSETLSFYSFNS